jgi:hypothetical protein
MSVERREGGQNRTKRFHLDVVHCLSLVLVFRGSKRASVPPGNSLSDVAGPGVIHEGLVGVLSQLVV